MRPYIALLRLIRIARAGCRTLVVLSACGCGLLHRIPAESDAASSTRLRHDVDALAADSMRGRVAASRDEIRAAHFIATQMLSLGLSPVPGEGSLELPYRYLDVAPAPESW